MHNIDVQEFSDWIEICLRFESEEVSKSDIVDILHEQNLYDSQDFANEFVANVWRELSRRLRLIGPNCHPFAIHGDRLQRAGDWKEFPAYSFCLVASMQVLYALWARRFGTDFTEQGVIFEELTKEALQAIFPDFEVFRIGWEKDAPVTAREVIRDVADRLSESQGDISKWVDEKAKDLGLDLVCHRSFPDGWTAKPVFLVQCASGDNWNSKLHTPEQNLWDTVIGWGSKPKKAFSMPFSISEKQFNYNCIRINGLFMDRYRLLSACHSNLTWVSDLLSDRIIAWCEPRLAEVTEQMPPYEP